MVHMNIGAAQRDLMGRERRYDVGWKGGVELGGSGGGGEWDQYVFYEILKDLI